MTGSRDITEGHVRAAVVATLEAEADTALHAARVPRARGTEPVTT